jgi:small subunit ribosomal protein S20e
MQLLTFYPSLLAPTETVKQIIINIEAGVEVEVTIAA